MADYGTQGTQFQRGDGGSPETFTAIGELLAVPELGLERGFRRVTNLGDTAWEQFKANDLADGGELTVELQWDKGDTVQQGLRTDWANKTIRNFKIVHNDGSPASEYSFQALVIGLQGPRGGLDETVQYTVRLKLTDAVTQPT